MSTCLVTGAGRGIGRSVAVALSQAGHRVALNARSSNELSETAELCPGETLLLPADITTSVEEIFSQVEATLGPTEILIINAGAGHAAPITKVTDDDWQHMLDLNLTAPFRCMRRAIPAMVSAGYGRIIVIASLASKIGEPRIAAYTAAKHGVLGLVRSAAAELSTTGVTVNAVCPGYVDTPMTDQTVRNIVRRTGRTEEETRKYLADKQPIGRLITVEEVTASVMYCVGNGAITGQGLNVDGGALQS